jgi:hypothetical protein
MEKMINIDKTVTIPMSDLDIKHYIDKPTVKYSELSRYNTIEELLPNDKDCFIMLVEHTLNNGHWVCLLRYNDIIEFFDSYGKPPSYSLKYTTKTENKKLGQDKNYLDFLLNGTKKKVIYNNIDYQKGKMDINSCGAHCVFRCLQMLNNNLNLVNYNKLMQKTKKETGLDFDKIVSAFINLRQ